MWRCCWWSQRMPYLLAESFASMFVAVDLPTPAPGQVFSGRMLNFGIGSMTCSKFYEPLKPPLRLVWTVFTTSIWSRVLLSCNIRCVVYLICLCSLVLSRAFGWGLWLYHCSKASLYLSPWITARSVLHHCVASLLRELLYPSWWIT